MKKLILPLLFVAAACQNKPQEPQVLTAPALEQKAESEKPQIVLASDIDPVCMMSVKEEYADTAMVDGKIYAFCGASCKEDFLKNPSEYLKDK
jgi:YHS domain-containing protein